MAIRWRDATPPLVLSVWPGESRPPAGVWIHPEVDRSVQEHLGRADVEQGGLLIGCGFTDPASGEVVHVQVLDSVAADLADGTAVSLRMEAAVWSAARERLQPGRLIVGWYHSHPGLTAFFSDTDRRTQRAFFGNTYSVGWVIDPIGGGEAFFLGGPCRPVARVAFTAALTPDALPGIASAPADGADGAADA